MITSVKQKSWVTRHNTLSMLRSLFMGKVWKYQGTEVTLRKDDEGNWAMIIFYGDSTEKWNISLNEFITIMSDENILNEYIPEVK